MMNTSCKNLKKEMVSVKEQLELIFGEAGKSSIECSDETVPSWYDETKFKRGQKYFEKNKMGIIFSNICGLLCLLGVPEVLKWTTRVSFADKLTTLQLLKRLEKVNGIYLQYYMDNFRPKSRFWKDMLQFRKMLEITTKNGRKSELSGINQKMLTLIQFGCMGFVTTRPQAFGISADNHEEVEGFIHVWRVVGWLYGLNDKTEKKTSNAKLEKNPSFLNKFRKNIRHKSSFSDKNKSNAKQNTDEKKSTAIWYKTIEQTTNQDAKSTANNYVKTISKQINEHGSLSENITNQPSVYQNIDLESRVNGAEYINGTEYIEASGSSDSYKTAQENYLQSLADYKTVSGYQRNFCFLPNHEDLDDDDDDVYDSFDDSDVEESRSKGAELSDESLYESINFEEIETKETEKECESLVNISKFQRTLWQDTPEVIKSGLLDSLTNKQKALCEAKYEVLTTEWSYTKSINVFCQHFMEQMVEQKVLNETYQHMLFGNIEEIRTCSKNFLNDLALNWEKSYKMERMCDIFIRYAQSEFLVYIDFCKNQISREHILRKLKESNKFNEFLKDLESDPICELLPFYSFLMLPVQRITRLPVLVSAILKQMEVNDIEYSSYQVAYEELTKVVTLCNELSNKVHQQEEFIQTWKMLQFSRQINVPKLDTIAERCLERKATFIDYTPRVDNKLNSFGKKTPKFQVTLFLFTDILVVAKYKSSESYTVLDYCARNLVEISRNEEDEASAVVENIVFQITLLENYDLKEVSLTIASSDEDEVAYWMNAFSPPISPYPDEQLYAAWDSPLVVAVKEYISLNKDTLCLEPDEVVKVSRKCNNWYFGESKKSKNSGWFPIECVKDVSCNYIRALNIKHRYRVLTNLASNFKALS